MTEEFLAELKLQGRSSPKDWQRFYLFLKVRKQAGQRDPPVPLILAASGESDATKHRRLGKQLRWAEANGCLGESVTYLLGVPIHSWNTCPLDQWNSESY